jgi:hypothetical protein
MPCFVAAFGLWRFFLYGSPFGAAFAGDGEKWVKVDEGHNGGHGDLEGQVFDMSASLRDACIYPYILNSRENDFRCIYL